MSHRKNLTNKKFGNLIVLSRKPVGRRTYWNCLCSCGKYHCVSQDSLLSGRTKSCGCKRIKHGQCKDYKTTPTYKCWDSMMQRCYNKKNNNYPRYGGKGITVSMEWHKFENFFIDMGERPSKDLSLDRFPYYETVYSKKTARWATRSQQNLNKAKLSGCASRYRGVRMWKYKGSPKWGSSIKIKGKEIFLGYSKTEVAAAKKFDKEAVKHGPDHILNFPKEMVSFREGKEMNQAGDIE